MANSRELTPLEYLVIGLISVKPQSGYSIMTFFDEGSSWSASPGTIYPILKRLEKAGIIAGELEMEIETRPRKVYTLSPLGDQLLNEWLREVPGTISSYEQREMAKWRFQFMEGRLPKHEILQWLENYLDALRIYDFGRRVFQEGTLNAMSELGQMSVHRQLIMEATLLENNTLRTWLEMAKARIAATMTNELRAVPYTPDPKSMRDEPAPLPDEDEELGDFGC